MNLNNILVTIFFSIYDGSCYDGSDDHINGFENSIVTNSTDFHSDVALFINRQERDPWDAFSDSQGVAFGCYTEIRNLTDATDTSFKHLLQFTKHCPLDTPTSSS